jgi:hypothetical protein
LRAKNIYIFRSVHGVSSTRIELKFSKAKAAVAGLATLVHAPALDGVDPAPDEGLVSLCDKVEEGSAEYLHRGEEAVVGAVADRA